MCKQFVVISNWINVLISPLIPRGFILLLKLYFIFSEFKSFTGTITSTLSNNLTCWNSNRNHFHSEFVIAYNLGQTYISTKLTTEVTYTKSLFVLFFFFFIFFKGFVDNNTWNNTVPARFASCSTAVCQICAIAHILNLAIVIENHKCQNKQFCIGGWRLLENLV